MGVLRDPVKWREVIDAYLELRDRPHMTPQRRGQQFNGLIADLFTCFGLTAKPDQQGDAGEIDVTFGVGNQRFILEAKWVDKRTPIDPIAKLQRRLDQRMRNVTGVFLSMSGYTPGALTGVDKGRQLDVLLLDQEHWEAMLFGLVPPTEMIDLLTDVASYQGQAYTLLGTLLRNDVPVPQLSFPPAAVSVCAPLADHVRTEVVLGGVRSRTAGLTLTGTDSMLLTTDDGVLKVDFTSRAVSWAVPVHGCHGRAVEQGDAILVQRGVGTGLYRNGQLRPVQPADLVATAPVALSPNEVAHVDDTTLRVADLGTGRSVDLAHVDGVIVGVAAGNKAKSLYLAVQDSGDRITVVRVTATKAWLHEVKQVPAPRPAEAAPVPVAQLVMPLPAPAAPQDSRAIEEQQGYRDGQSIAGDLPLFALDAAATVHFDIARWLEPFRETWRQLVTREAPAGTELLPWLPQVARKLGSLAAPDRTAEAHFAPSPAYVAGFGNGMREAWHSAVRRQAVPYDAQFRQQWLREAVGKRAVLRGALTLTELRTSTLKGQAATTSKWFGRVVLWLVTSVLGLFEIVAIIIAATGGWPGIGQTIAGLLVFTVPFLAFLTWTVLDLRRFRRLRRTASASLVRP
ncbi:restriction endonuclease [Saccharothrix coeruleofusca]|uniref:Restriction endonuclease type IV Mrr domain-containing protein n=1 Tax=Saccharothrix coeruleofusca TaxID=33919 RepID=A0A918AR78_9PSEU|nr:restriction endonuclease [Saccharothrix coeruleofusca]GGP72591.1 hypothetical protein GCM10010185_52400 [Saccharothrix coeruleofusca]